MKKILLPALILCASYLSAQTFMPEFGQQWNRTTYVVKNDDSKVWGKAVFGIIGPNGLTQITLKDTVSGEKTKFKIADMKEVGVSAKGMTKLSAMTNALENTNSIKDATRSDYKSLLEADYFLYRRVVDKKGKPRILQLLNPGFESKMQVYVDPKAKETGGSKLTGGLTGGLEKSYYVTRGSSFGIYVKKSKYKKSMSSIFDGCSEVLKEFSDANFKDFAKHVYYYENECE